MVLQLITLLLLFHRGQVGLGKTLAVYIHPLAHDSVLGAFACAFVGVGWFGWAMCISAFAFDGYDKIRSHSLYC
jgi:hypothetical protein